MYVCIYVCVLVERERERDEGDMKLLRKVVTEGRRENENKR